MPITQLKLLACLISLLFLFFTFNFLLISPVFAQKAPEDPSQSNWNSEYQTNHSGNDIINMLSCLGAGPIYSPGCVIPVITSSGVKTKIAFNGEGGGAIGAISGFLAQVYDNPPISGTQYMAQAVKDGFGLQPKPAFAQVTGSGAGVLQPVQKIWSFFRNVAYAGFIIIFLVIGFMIMLRQRINPQTVVSVQQALPGIVIGLILVTFSYFLAGLFVDMAFLLSQFAGILFLSQVGGEPGAAGHVTILLNNHSFIDMMKDFITKGDLLGASSQVGHTVTDVVFPGVQGGIVVGLLGALATCLNPIGLAAIAATAGAAIIACAGAGAATGLGGGGVIVSGIVFLIFLIGLIQAMIRLVFALIMAYVQIILATIFGPLLILLSAIPGRGGTLALWWKPLIANALIFPAIFIFFLIIATVLGIGDPFFLSGGLDPKGFSQALPLMGGTPLGLARAILGYGLLLAAPGIPEFIRNVLGAKMDQVLAGAANKNLGAGSKGAGLIGSTLGVGGYNAAGGGIVSGLEAAGATGRWRTFQKNLERRKFGA